MITNDLQSICALKDTTAKFNGLPADIQALAETIAPDHFVLLDGRGSWVNHYHTKFNPDCRYRLKRHFKFTPPKEDFVEYPIYTDDCGTLVFDMWGNTKKHITDPTMIAKAKFEGYKYADGKLCGEIRRYKSNKTQSYYTIGMEAVEAGKATAIYPVAMVFRVPSK